MKSFSNFFHTLGGYWCASALLLCGTPTLQAAPRPPKDAEKIAENFLHSRMPHAAKRSTGALHLAATAHDVLPHSPAAKRTVSETPAFYIYNEGDGAFVIVSGDDRMPDVLGYSLDGSFAARDLPENVQGWLLAYDALFRAAGQERRHLITQSSDTGDKFPASVAPLLQNIAYDQSSPYNAKCPEYGGERCVTGCVATAVAQIMRYYKYPEKGEGRAEYTTRTLGLELTYDFSNATFDWDNMLPAYEGIPATSRQEEAVAELMLACGMACEMDYGTDISGASDLRMLAGLYRNLGYDKDIYYVYRSWYTSSQWMEMLKTEISAQRPVYYGGESSLGGHAFVIDGYDTDNMVHVNWGWGGQYNGYFEILTLDPSGTGIGGYTDNAFQFRQGMIVGLQPEDGTDVPGVHFTVGNMYTMENSVQPGETFPMYVDYIFNYGTDFEGYGCLVLEKDGIQHPITEIEQMYLKPGYGYAELTISSTMPEGLEDGTYDLYFGFRSQEEEQWSKALGNRVENTCYKVVLSNGTYKFYPDPDFFPASDLTCHISLKHEVYAGTPVEGSICIKNTNEKEEFFAPVTPALLSADASEILHAFTTAQILIAPGDSVTIDIQAQIPLVEGDYALQALYQGDAGYYTIGDAMEIHVEDAQITEAQIGFSNLTLKEKRIECGKSLVVCGHMELPSASDGTAEVFHSRLYHVYKAVGDNEIRETGTQDLYVKPGSGPDYEYEWNIQAEEGNYVYSLLSSDPEGMQTTTWATIEFTVVAPAGINGTETDGRKTILHWLDSGRTLSVSGPTDAVQARIYATDGRLIGSSDPDVQADGSLHIPIGKVSKGTYLLRLWYKDGGTSTVKFLR